MKIDYLRVESGNNGKSIVSIRVDCHFVTDVDDIIAWLNLAKEVMNGWEAIHTKPHVAQLDEQGSSISTDAGSSRAVRTNAK